MKAFLKRLFLESDPLTNDQQPDERVKQEAHTEYARVYFLFIALAVVATVVQLFVTRHVLVYLPVIIGGGGSLVYYIVMSRRAGLLRPHETDERIAAHKNKIKSQSYLFCLMVYILGALPILFIDVPFWALEAVFLTWFIPTAIAVIRIGKRGLYAPGTQAEGKTMYKQLALSTAKSAVFFGLFMSLFMGLFVGGLDSFDGMGDAAWQLGRDAFLYAALWGVLFFLGMVGVTKISERYGKKRNPSNESDDAE